MPQQWFDSALVSLSWVVGTHSVGNSVWLYRTRNLCFCWNLARKLALPSLESVASSRAPRIDILVAQWGKMVKYEKMTLVTFLHLIVAVLGWNFKRIHRNFEKVISAAETPTLPFLVHKILVLGQFLGPLWTKFWKQSGNLHQWDLSFAVEMKK